MNPKLICTPSKLSIDLIEQHPLYSDPQVLDYLISVDYLLSEPGKHLNKKAIEYLLDLHPVKVIPGKDEKYFCIGGLRSLSIARACYRGDESPIPVIIATGIGKKGIREHCLKDLVISSLCFSVQSPESVCRFLDGLADEFKKEVFVNNHGPSNLSRLLKVSRETIRKWISKPHKTL